MNKVLISMIDDNFMEGFYGFIHSLKQHNPNFNYPFLLINTGLSKQNQKKCIQEYNKIEFINPLKGNYIKVNFNRTHSSLQNTYYKLEIFSYTKYDRIVFIDLDTIILDKIDYLFKECKNPIHMAKAYNAGIDTLRGDFNSGVMVLNKPVINQKIYEDLISLSSQGYSMPDQKVINRYFKKRITCIPKKYNCEKRIKGSKKFNFRYTGRDYPLINDEKIVILHFVSQKPWMKDKTSNNLGYEDLEGIWRRYR